MLWPSQQLQQLGDLLHDLVIVLWKLQDDRRRCFLVPSDVDALITFFFFFDGQIVVRVVSLGVLEKGEGSKINKLEDARDQGRGKFTKPGLEERSGIVGVFELQIIVAVVESFLQPAQLIHVDRNTKDTLESGT